MSSSKMPPELAEALWSKIFGDGDQGLMIPIVPRSAPAAATVSPPPTATPAPSSPSKTEAEFAKERAFDLANSRATAQMLGLRLPEPPMPAANSEQPKELTDYERLKVANARVEKKIGELRKDMERLIEAQSGRSDKSEKKKGKKKR